MRDLDRRLLGVGAGGPQPQVSAVWSALLEWAAEPVMPVDSGSVDEIEVLAAWHEPDFAGHDWSYFDAPEELGQPIFAISVSRTIHPHRMTLVSGLLDQRDDSSVRVGDRCDLRHDVALFRALRRKPASPKALDLCHEVIDDERQKRPAGAFGVGYDLKRAASLGELPLG